jgi:hypothetical protein
VITCRSQGSGSRPFCLAVCFDDNESRIPDTRDETGPPRLMMATVDGLNRARGAVSGKAARGWDGMAWHDFLKRANKAGEREGRLDYSYVQASSCREVELFEVDDEGRDGRGSAVTRQSSLPDGLRWHVRSSLESVILMAGRRPIRPSSSSSLPREPI